MSSRRALPDPPPSDEIAASPNRDFYSVERVVFFSDAVFAIAITLLALEIRLPSASEIRTDGDLLRQLLGNWHQYMSFVISFLVIGLFWTGHNRKFAAIVRVDGGLMWLNLLLLMGVAFVPFPTTLLSEFGGKVATTFYALTMIVLGLVSAALWWHASLNRLIRPDYAPEQRHHELVSPLLTSGLFFLSIGLAFISPGLARLSWILLVPVLRLSRWKESYLGRFVSRLSRLRG